MFSCCRANTKNSKKNKHKKHDEKNTEVYNETQPKQLVIPTITVENGKSSETNTNSDDPEAEEVAVVIKFESCQQAKEILESNATALQQSKNQDTKTSEDSTCCRGDGDEIAINVQNAIKQRASVSSTTSTLNSVSIKSTDNDTTNVNHIKTLPAATTTNSNSQLPAERIAAAAATGITAGPTPTKSCLSRHNSMHTSIKKKVNISTRAEIIEPEPLPLLTNSLIADDDDVFSDSMPAPKRESMCAPYIPEHDEVAESVAFAHGLPAWFDDERLSEIGCIEPPVTPVGRDELELKRQRLYTDLLRAAHVAVEHNWRFTPFNNAVTAVTTTATTVTTVNPAATGPPTAELADAYNTTAFKIGACDLDLKPSIADNLEHLVNRLELLVERLERSLSAKELELANRVFDTVLEQKSEKSPTPPSESSTVLITIPDTLNQQTDKLNQRIERIESSLQRINERQQSVDSEEPKRVSTVLADYQHQEEDLPLLPPSLTFNMSVSAFEDIIAGPLNQYLALSRKIGGDVAHQAEFVRNAFNAQLKYVTLATQIAKPPQDKQVELLKPTSTQISAIQDYREKQRASPYFNHLSAVSESIPALGWVCVSPTPGPHVKEMNDAGQFYTNRVLKEWKEKDSRHVEWARAWIQTLTELQAYIKQFHTTGLVWSGKGAIPPAGAGAPPPPPPLSGVPPPPPMLDLSSLKLDNSADDRSALFAQINQGEAITKNLKKVTADMQTHKNAALRTGPAPFKTPAQFGSVPATASSAVTVSKPPVFTRDGKKWLIEYQNNNTGLVVQNAEMNNVVYMFKCENSTLTVKGKVNNIVFDSCKKCCLLFDSVVASVEFVNCQSVQMQVLGSVPTVSIDKTDGCQMYLSNDSLGVEIVSSKSSEMNIMLPESNGDYTELAVPEQFKTTISGKALKTVCVDSLG